MGQGKAGVQRDIRAFFVAPQRSPQPHKPEGASPGQKRAADQQQAQGGGGRQAGPAADSRPPGTGAAACEQRQKENALLIQPQLEAQEPPAQQVNKAHGPDAAACPDDAEEPGASTQSAADAAAPVVEAAVLAGQPGAAAGAQQDGAGGGGSGSSGSVLTDYELERLARIRRNQEVMLSLGLAGPSIEPKPAPTAPPKRLPRKRLASAAAEGTGAAPVRRSARTRGAATGEDNATAAGAAAAATPAAPEPEPELQYDDSSVRRYVCEVLGAAEACTASGSSNGDGASGGSAVPEGAWVAGFRRLPGCLHDPALARAYSVDSRPGLVVAGGKDGIVSVWGSREMEAGRLPADEAVPPLLSHKLHKGWVADVQFVSGSGGSVPSSSSSSGGGDGSSLLLLSAGNDGALCLWDLGRAAETGGGGRGGSVVPQCLARSTELHAGGIFSLAEHSGRVLTASKDATVVISSLAGGSGTASLAAVQRYDNLHEGVVKCARWRDADTFASCGNDRRLCVVDARQPPSAGPGLVIEGAHATAINCLRWHPSSGHLLLCASHDPAILLHDIRQPAQPLHRLLGHSPAARINSIYQPAFVAGGDAVAASCERSPLLSLYCTTTGAAISRGSIDVAVGATACGGERGAPLLCTAARTVLLYQPTWEAA